MEMGHCRAKYSLMVHFLSEMGFAGGAWSGPKYWVVAGTG